MTCPRSAYLEAKWTLVLNRKPVSLCYHRHTVKPLCSPEDHERFHSLARNRVSNISFAVSSAGEILVLVIMVGILKGLHAEQNTENNTKAFSVLIAFSGAVWRKFSHFRNVVVFHIS